MTLHKKDQSIFVSPPKNNCCLRPSRKTLKREHSRIPTGHTFEADTLQSLTGVAKGNTHGLGFQDHNLQGTVPQIAIQKQTERESGASFSLKSTDYLNFTQESLSSFDPETLQQKY